jgi:hypothetical protein
MIITDITVTTPLESRLYGVVIPDDGSLTVEVIMSCDTVGV